MKKSSLLTSVFYPTLLVLSLPFTGCVKMSEEVEVYAAGVNGGFEVSQKDLPVNWLMYTPNTVPDAEFEIVLDTIDFVEGTQSLRFDVKKCMSIGGWKSPGFTNEFFTAGRFRGEKKYKLRFSIKNEGSSYRIRAGGVLTKGGEMKTIIEGKEDIPDWESFEFEVDVPQDMWLRLELNVLSPGTFWIDDVVIEEV